MHPKNKKSILVRGLKRIWLKNLNLTRHDAGFNFMDYWAASDIIVAGLQRTTEEEMGGSSDGLTAASYIYRPVGDTALEHLSANI